MDELYDRALHRTVYNSVAVPCEDLQSTAEKLVNGFTVVLFGQRAIAFETKTGEKRSPSAPEVENTVKGPKDAFTETVRTNTGPAAPPPGARRRCGCMETVRGAAEPDERHAWHGSTG